MAAIVRRAANTPIPVRSELRRMLSSEIEADSIPDEEIERRASALILEYCRKRNRTLELPVPVEEILELDLKYALSVGPISAEIGESVVGATYFKGREVRIESDLAEGSEEEFRRTVAHEMGHIVLHSEYGADTPWIHCGRESSKRIERQADAFASFLLMPEEKVQEVWAREVESPKPLAMEEYEEEILIQQPFIVGRILVAPRHWDGIFGAADGGPLKRSVARHLAPFFGVPKKAMLDRLERLNYFSKPDGGQEHL